MANQAHSGLARCIRTRDIGVRMIGAAHQARLRRLAMEAPPRPADRTAGSSQAFALGQAWLAAVLIAATPRLLALDGPLAKTDPKTLRYRIPEHRCLRPDHPATPGT